MQSTVVCFNFDYSSFHSNAIICTVYQVILNNDEGCLEVIVEVKIN